MKARLLLCAVPARPSDAPATGMAIAPWNVLVGGKIRTDAEEQRRMESGEGGRTMLMPSGCRMISPADRSTSSIPCSPPEAL